MSVDLSLEYSVDAVLSKLRIASVSGESGWKRAWGIDEIGTREHRLPTLAELDRACGDVPWVIHHRSGRAVLLNTPARIALGRAAGREWEPVDNSKPPLASWDDPALRFVPIRSASDMDLAVKTVSLELAAMGVARVTDATATNAVSDYEQFTRWTDSGVFMQCVDLLIGVDAVDDAVDAGLFDSRPGARTRMVDVAGVKIATSADGIGDQVEHARSRGLPVAIHATDPDELEAALIAFERLGPPRQGRDRIEHLGLVIPGQLQRLAATGAAAVTNPGFIAERGRKYVAEMTNVELDWIYPMRSALEMGIHLSAGSDRPVTAGGPLAMITAAIHRVAPTDDGPVVVGSAERLSPDEALSLVSAEGAVTGTSMADAVLIKGDPREGTDGARVLATVAAGKVIWQTAEYEQSST